MDCIQKQLEWRKTASFITFWGMTTKNFPGGAYPLTPPSLDHYHSTCISAPITYNTIRTLPLPRLHHNFERKPDMHAVFMSVVLNIIEYTTSCLRCAGHVCIYVHMCRFPPPPKKLTPDKTLRIYIPQYYCTKHGIHT